MMAIGCFGIWGSAIKMKKMAMVSGMIKGATTQEFKVQEKWTDPDKGTPWIRFRPGDIRQRSDHRINLPDEIFKQHRVGDTIEIVFLPDDTRPHHRDGHYANTRQREGERKWMVMLTVFMLAGGIILIIAVCLRSRTKKHKPHSVNFD